jgi:hypothetical protein
LIIDGTYGVESKKGKIIFSDDGKYIASVIDGTLVLIDAISGHTLWVNKEVDAGFIECFFYNSLSKGTIIAASYYIQGPYFGYMFINLKGQEVGTRTEDQGIPIFSKNKRIVLFYDDVTDYVRIFDLEGCITKQDETIYMSKYGDSKDTIKKNTNKYVQKYNILVYGNIESHVNLPINLDSGEEISNSRRYRVHIPPIKNGTIEIEDRANGHKYSLFTPIQSKKLTTSDLHHTVKDKKNTSAYNGYEEEKKNFFFSEDDRFLAVLISGEELLIFQLGDKPVLYGTVLRSVWPTGAAFCDQIGTIPGTGRPYVVFALRDNLKKPDGMALAEVTPQPASIRVRYTIAQSPLSPVSAAAFSTRHVYIAFANGRVVAVDISNGSTQSVLPPNNYFFTALTASNDGKTLYLGTSDGRILREQGQGKLEELHKAGQEIKRLLVNNQETDLWFLSKKENQRR